MIRSVLAFVMALGLLSATAAELPQRSESRKATAPTARTCCIDGEPGVATPGGGCIRVSGSISVGVGVVKH